MLDGWAKVDQAAEGLSGAHYLHTLSKPFHYITRQQAHKFKAIWVGGGERAAPLAINYLNLGIRPSWNFFLFSTYLYKISLQQNHVEYLVNLLVLFFTNIEN